MFTTQQHFKSQMKELISYWLECVLSKNTAEESLDIFKSLFMDGMGSSDPAIAEAVEELALKKDKPSEQEFLQIIDQACYQLITYALANNQPNIVSQLVALISKTTASHEKSYNRLPIRLNHLWKIYIQNGYFQRLRKLQIILTKRSTDPSASRVLANLLDRYPFLYLENLLTENVSSNYLVALQSLQRQAQRDYELKVSSYITYQIRKAILKRNPNPQKEIISVPNPTLLKSRELGIVLKSCVNDGEKKDYWDNAFNFQGLFQDVVYFLEFKKFLYFYLIQDLENIDYVQNIFQRRLKKKLKNIMPEHHNEPITEILKVGTYTQLLDLMLIVSAERSDHTTLIDLLSNLGPAATVGLLLKIVLVYPPAQTAVEYRLSILFNHYYNSNYDQLPWLIQLLESWQIVSSIYFGKLDSSVLKQILSEVIVDTK